MLLRLNGCLQENPMTENEKKNNEVVENEKNNSSGSVAGAAGGIIGGIAGAFLGGPIGGVAGAALGSFIGKIFGSDNRTIEDEAKAFDNIAQAIKPMYSGDFDKALDSIRNYRNKNAHDANEDGIYINPKYFESAKRFVEYFKDSQKPLPPENSEYDKALKYWEILNNNDSAKQCFLASIEKESETRIDAIKDYIDFLFATEDEKTAANALEEYKKNYSQSKPLLEKAVSLYSQIDIPEQLHANLLALSEVDPNNGAVLLRLADCEYRLGMFEKSIETAKKAFATGCWIAGYLNQVVDSYIALSEYEKAKNEIIDTPLSKYDFEKEKHYYFYQQYFCRFTNYLAYKIYYAEQNQDVANEFSLDEDNFTVRNTADLFKRIKKYKKDCFNEYDLNDALHDLEKIKKSRNCEDISIASLYTAYIIKHLYGKTEQYYEYISRGLLYLGLTFGSKGKYEKAKSCFLSAVKNSIMVTDSVELECDIMEKFSWSSNDFSGEFHLGSYYVEESMKQCVSHVEYIKREDLKMIRYSSLWRNFLSTGHIGRMPDEKEVAILLGVDKQFNDAEQFFRNWLSFVEKDVDFKADLKDTTNAVKDSVLTFESDKEFIEKYLDSISKMKEFYKYDDFDNRILILSQVLSKLDALESNIRENDLDTIFFENYLEKVISATRNNLNTLIDRTKKDFATKITIDVPITKVTPNKSGNISLSVSISNKENRAPAKNMQLFVENNAVNKYKETIFHKNLSSKNLKGGSSISETITISNGGQQSFSIKIRVSYKGGSAEKDVQISIDAGKFEEIRNPYIAGNPVEKDDMFFGRDELIKNLAASLMNDTTRCVIIYGQKRSGKSSIFQHLRKKLEDKFVVLSFSTGSDITSEVKFYICVRDELLEYLENNDFDSGIIEKFENFDVSDLLSFQRFVRKVNREVCKPQNKELLLMIDEFTALYEYMKDPECSLGKENFMDKWKAMSEQNLFKSALIGQDNMPEFISAYPNQFQVTEPVRVSYLKREYAKDLIVKPILLNGKSRYREDSDKKIADWFNGQPYYIQTYCKKLVDYLNFKKDKSIAMAVAEKVKKDLFGEADKMQLFDNLVDKDDKDSWNILKKIAKSDVDDVPLDLSALSDSEKTALNKLVVRDVVNEKQDRYQIKIPFFREWIREYK